MKKSNAAALAAYASQLTGGGREMIAILTSIARNDLASNSERIAAAREVLDRTCGRAAQVVEHEVTVMGADYDVARLGTARVLELKAMLAELAATSGAPPPQLAGVIDAASTEQPALVMDEDEEGEP